MLDARRSHELYSGSFVTDQCGTKRTVVGQTAAGLPARADEYAAKGENCPAFAKCAAARVRLKFLGHAKSERDAYARELAWFGWECQRLDDWKESCRGACFVLPSWGRWPAAADS